MTTRLFKVILMAGSMSLIGVSSVLGGTITIDDFEAPNASEAFFTFDPTSPPFTPKNTVLVKNSISASDPGIILGDERDILLEVVGTAQLLSAAGEVGGEDSMLKVATAFGAGTFAILQYDGVDTGDSEETGLDDAEGLLDVDLTDSGANDRLRLSFISLDAGDNPLMTMELAVDVVGADGTASLVKSVDESTGPVTLDLLFSDFTISGPPTATVFDTVKSLTFLLNNSGTPTANVDFELDSIVAVPEPSTVAMLAGLLICAASLAFSRRK